MQIIHSEQQRIKRLYTGPRKPLISYLFLWGGLPCLHVISAIRPLTTREG